MARADALYTKLYADMARADALYTKLYADMARADALYTKLYADMAELADAQVSGSCGRPCRFNSCYPHQKNGAPNGAPFFWYAYCNITGVVGGGANESERFACGLI